MTLTVARADALFTSDLRLGSKPTRAETTAAIAAAVREHHGHVSECASDVAWRYGEDAQTAAERMAWALVVVTNVYKRGSR